MQIFVELDKIYDIGDRRVELGLGQAVIDERRADVIITGKFRMKAQADIDQGLDAAVDDDGAAGWRKIAGDQFEQCGLAGAVAADDADPLAAPNGERYVFERGAVMVFRLSPEPQMCQAKGVERLLRRTVVKAINLGDPG